MHKITNMPGRNEISLFPKKNIMRIVILRIVIVFFKYNTFYFTYPPPPPPPPSRKTRFQPYYILPSCLLFIANWNLENIIQFLQIYIIINGWRRFQKRFHQVLKQCSVFYLRYCVLRYFVKYLNMAPFQSIQWLAASLPNKCHLFVLLCIKTLQYPIVLHCRIVPIEKLKTIVASPIKLVEYNNPNSKSSINLKVTRKYNLKATRTGSRGVEFI